MSKRDDLFIIHVNMSLGARQGNNIPKANL